MLEQRNREEAAAAALTACSARLRGEDKAEDDSGVEEAEELVL